MKDIRVNTVFKTVEELDKAEEDYLNIMNIYNDRLNLNKRDVELLRRKVETLESIKQEREKAKEEVPVEEQEKQLPALYQYQLENI